MVLRTKLKRNNHYIPKCYQEGFTDSSGRVWVKFAGEKEAQHRKPRSIGKKRNFYISSKDGVEDDKVEDFFSKEIEDSFAGISRRIKNEGDRFSSITVAEVGALCRFVASQAVRTMANKQCMEQQVGGYIATNTFVLEMAKQIRAILNFWGENPPKVNFYTPLPYVGERFITGDNPVSVIQNDGNSIWVPSDTPYLEIVDLTQILKSPNHEFRLSLSPYLCVSLQGQGSGEVHLPPQALEPSEVRSFNKLIRDQSTIFVLARDQDSLS